MAATTCSSPSCSLTCSLPRRTRRSDSVLDSVREFRVLTGTYSAEYGRQSGGQVIVTTKSGSNTFHGAVWNFHRNSVLDARNFFAPTKPKFRRNQYGVVLGGPVRKD